jgi:hypothetical protein
VIGLVDPGNAGAVALWVAALATLVTWSILVGARRPFAWSQRLLAGMATGYLALLAIREVIVPGLVEPLVQAPAEHPALWIALVLGIALVGSRWLPPAISSLPIAVLLGATAAFALGGAIVGTVIPQLAGVAFEPSATGGALASGAIATIVAVLVLLAFVHGQPRSRAVAGMAAAGRWIMLGGLGVWLGYLIVARLALLADRVAFLVVDWLGVGR